MKRDARDAEMSRITRSLGYCQARLRGCFGRNGLQDCHIVSRKYMATRWAWFNRVCMCSHCHAYFTDHPSAFGKFLNKIIGSERREKIEFASNKSAHWKECDKKELLKMMKKCNNPYDYRDVVSGKFTEMAELE